MRARGTESEPLQQLVRELGGMDLREAKRFDASRPQLKQQLTQTNSAVVHQRPERDELRFLDSAGGVEEVGLDPLVRGDGEPVDVGLSRKEGLDRALPADLRIGVCK